MQKNQSIFHRKQLVIAIGMALVGGVMTGCSDDDAAAGPSSVYTYASTGGAGGNLDDGEGGNGSGLQIYNEGGTGGIVISKSGVANTNFTRPITALTTAGADLGDNPLAITVATTIKTVDYGSEYTDGVTATTEGQLYRGTDDVLRTAGDTGTAAFAGDVELPAGTAYTRLGDVGVYERGAAAAAATDVRFTGLSVAASTVLTLEDNFSGGYCCDGTNQTVYGVVISFGDDISNSGTITRDTANSNSGLNLIARNYVGSGIMLNAGVEADEDGGSIGIFVANGVSNSGLVNTSGFDETGEDGGDGASIDLRAGGYVINSGTLDASGGDSDDSNSGDGGDVDIYAAYVENTASINTSAGVAGAGAEFGSGGGDVNLESDYITNSRGDITTSGGAGAEYAGSGGDVYLDNNDLGRVINAGNVTTVGGDQLDGAYTSGGGGDGGELVVFVNGGDFVNSGDITTTGGNSAETGGDVSGGDGGEIYVVSYSGDDYTPPGSIEISGNIQIGGGYSLAGGAGDGGDGSEMYLEIDNDSDTTNTARIALLGYASIDMSGGGGADGGGGAGAENSDRTAYLETGEGYRGDTDEYTIGSIVNNVPMTVRGGNSTATGTDDGYGGDGGEVEMFTSTSSEIEEAVDANDEGAAKVTNTAAIDVSGGDGIDGTDGGNSSAGDGGRVYMNSYHATNNSGALAANGGSGAYYSGDGGEIFLDAELDTTNSGALAVSGGDTDAGDASSAGAIFIYAGDNATNRGVLTANGGNGVTYGGSGGEVWFGADVITNSASGSAAGGDGENADSGGFVYMSADTKTTNSGAFTLTGGDASAGDGGGGGWSYMYAGEYVTNSGAFNMSGGVGAATGAGGNGGSFDTYADIHASNSGAITANGGYGPADGGDGGDIEINGAKVSNSGALSVNGGSADDPFAGDSVGGDGGEIEVQGTGLSDTTNSGARSYAAGTGETDGEEGRATIGIVCEGNCTP